MTSRTETNSTVTETINSIDYRTGWEYTVTGVGVDNNGSPLNPPVNTSTVTVTAAPTTASDGGTVTGSVTSSFDSLDLSNNGSFTITNPGGTSSSLRATWGQHDEPNNNPARYHHRERNRHNVNVHTIGNATKRTAVIILGGVTIFGSTPVLGESVGGVSATANPIANSSAR